MKLDEALEQLDCLTEIAERTRRFDGFRWFPVALSGTFGIVGGGLQTAWLRSSDDQLIGFVLYWIAIAVVCLSVIVVEMGCRYRMNPAVRTRRMTYEIMLRLLPSFVAGAAVTWVIAATSRENGWMLPGLWALLMGLGIFSVATMLHPIFQWVGAWYLVTGVFSLLFARGEFALSPLSMAIPFGIGQCLTSYLIYRSMVEPNRSEESDG